VRMLGCAMVALMLAAGSVSAQDAVRPTPPLMLGGDAEYDACPSPGVVEGLNPRGDGFLSVRAGPSTDRREIDRLGNGVAVFICVIEGDWFGIVYPQSARCGVGSPWPRRRAYQGPCRSGWVHRRFVRQTAG
jgi:hypothetical protein